MVHFIYYLHIRISYISIIGIGASVPNDAIRFNLVDSYSVK